MVELEMAHWHVSGLSKGRSTWRLGAKTNENISLPDDLRLSALWAEHLSEGGVLTIESRGPNYCVIEINIGTKPDERQPFLDAVALETTPED